ncbi:hypothetical protein ABFY60_10755 [Lysinibacillus pakistanensis]|uniref:hypothetical protein n=1 Tax=Lysinibacillus pakistanensis TaxID=759811 RepID=UPI003D2C7597
MNFNYNFVKDKLEEKDLEKLKLYTEENSAKILREREKETFALVPLSSIFREEKEYLKIKYHSFLYSLENNGNIAVELVG